MNMEEPIKKKDLEDMLHSLIGYMDGRFERIDQRFEDVDLRFVRIEEKLQDHDRQFLAIREQLHSHERIFDRFA